MEEQKYTMQGLEEYIRQGEPGQRERGEAWRVAIGLQQVDGLTPSSYLLDTARQHIEGEISISRAKELIDSYYQSASHRDDIEVQRTEEADKVSARITEILSEKTFTFSPSQLTSIHRRLFEGVYKQAGQFRDYNITKNEWVLNGETIFYADFGTISDTLNYELRTEREFSYANVPVDDAIRHLMRFCANIWQIHAFCEGNTRTTAVFMIKYLRTLGFNVLNDLFAQNSWYFRNALVRANYSNLQKGITETTVFLEHFFRSMLLGEEHSFRNRELHIDWKDAESTISTQDNDIQNQSANSALYNLLKCNYCTLEEIAVLRVIQDNPTITQKEIAAEVGKSERTVKSLTVTLQEKEILKRVGSRRTGKWEIVIVFLLSIFLNIGQVFAQSPNYNIGDVITNPDGSKGVVFWLSPDGSGGWMCALNDVSGTFAWSTQSVAVPGFPALTTPSTSTWEAYATVTADTAGYSHTQKLRAAGNASTYPAAYAVDFAHGWYLPAIGQLLKLYGQQATISAVLAANGGSEISRTNTYWSSTYATNTNGYFLINPYGYWYTTSKSTAYYVRPVRSFSTRAMVYDTTLTYQWSNGASTPYVNVSPSVSSSYTVTATSGFGCSNTAEVSVVVANGSSQTLYDTICAGNSGYTLNGFNLTAAQTATAGDTVCTATLSEGTCSTTVTLHLHRKAPATATLNASICPGECYYLNGMELCNAGTYTQHLTAANGCDSTLTLQLSISTPDTTRISDVVCQGEPYTGYGFNIPADSTMIPHTIVETVCTPSLQTGCDSCTILTLTVNPVDTVHFNETICQGEPYIGHGFDIPADSTMIPHTIVETVCTPSLQTGCDSCTILTLTVNPVDTVRFYETICQGEPYTGHGFDIPVDSTMIPHVIVETVCTPSLQTGCDSCTILTLTVNTIDTVRFNETICQGEPYTSRGFNIPADSTAFPHTIVETVCTPSLQTGCDSCTILTLTVNNSAASEFSASNCLNYTWNDSTYHTSGDYVQHFPAANGCDSVVTLHLTIIDTIRTDITDSACFFHTWNGNTYEESGDYSIYYVTAQGCDSMVTLHLTINHPQNQHYTVTSCDHYTWEDGTGDTYYESGVYQHNHLDAHGCWQVDWLHLNIIPVDTVFINDSINQNNPYTAYGFNIPADSTAYPHVIVETVCTPSLQTGCDSCTVLTLTVLPAYYTSVTTESCDSYTWNGITYTASGDYIQQFQAVNGYDSTVTLHLTINHPVHQAFTIDACETFTWTDGNGQTYTTGGDYTYTHNDANSCMQVDTLHLTISSPAHQGVEISVCDAYIWGDSTYTESGTYTRHFQTSHGCDSTINLVLTVNHNSTMDTTVSTCNSFTWNGTTYTETPAEPLVFHYTNAKGCDSTVTLHLTINQHQTINYTATVCQRQPYNGHGFNIPADSTTYPHVIVETRRATSLQTGCDSCTILTLTVLPPFTSQFNATACGSYTWNGTTYTSSGNYQQTFTSHNGCDSIVTLHLTIYNPTNRSEALTACASYTWATGNGQTYTASGTYTHSHTDNHGCTQVDTLHLTIIHPSHQSYNVEACETYTWTDGNSETYTESGIYTYTHQDAQYCIQTDTLHLTINHGITINIEDQICQGEPYNWHGFNISADSTMIPHVIVETRRATSLQTGCDSCTILTLTVLPSYDLTFEDRVCQGDAYENHGFIIPADSTMIPHVIVETQNFASLQTGCDSTVTLNLSVVEESVIIIGPSVDFCETSTALLEAESPMSNFVWSTGETTQSIVVTGPGTYTVVAIEGNCSASAQYVITPCEFTLYLPNSITAANADGLNDIFQIAESQQVQIKDDEFSIVIYDRWGIKVFHSYDKAFQWDGKINGRVLQGNMYVYHITYRDLLNRFKTMRGTVITF